MKIHGKEYIEVKDRVAILRKDYKNFKIETEIVLANADECLIKALIKDEKNIVVATGHAYERADNKQSMVNKTSHVENCETSAVGRALGMLGIGIETSIASADEVQGATKQQSSTFDTAMKVEPKNPQELQNLRKFCNDNYPTWNEIEKEKIKKKIDELKIKFGEV